MGGAGGVDGFKNTQWYLLRLVAGGTGNKGNGVFVQRERSELTMGPGWRGGGGGHCNSGISAFHKRSFVVLFHLKWS